jgi:NAD(P)-dependent dehydrogenase (short-subunit alcohol dehydrogenase family)
MRIEGNVALVTGGASGLGRESARHLHARGASVVILDKSRDAARCAAEEIGERATWICGDILDDQALASAIDAAADLGPLRVCLAVAGGALGWERIVQANGKPHSMDLFRETLELNLVGTFNTVRWVAAAMSALKPAGDDHERGAIVTTSSIVGLAAEPGQIAYGCAKSSVMTLTTVAARELGPLGIRVNCIVPSLMLTETWDGTPTEVMDALISRVPFPKRFGKPIEFALLAEHLITNQYLNGHLARLDGGVRDLAS